MLLFPPTLPLLSLSPLSFLSVVQPLPSLLCPCFCVKSCLDVDLFALFLFRRSSFLYLSVLLLSKSSPPFCFSSTRLSTSSRLSFGHFVASCFLLVISSSSSSPSPTFRSFLSSSSSSTSIPSSPPVLGGICAVVTPCRSEGTMWPSWTPSASWTPIWTRVSPLTLSPPPTSWVRS